jgi:hypothetical protein
VTCVGPQPCRSVDREPEVVSEQGSFTWHSDVVRLADDGVTVRVLSQAVLGLWEVVNHLTRLRPTRRQRYRVTIFGSARAGADHWVYAAVRDLAAELTRLGCDIVTGGGPGLMQAANEGARMAGSDAGCSNRAIRPVEPARPADRASRPGCQDALTCRRRGTTRWAPRSMELGLPLRQHYPRDRCAPPRMIRYTLPSPCYPMAGME